MSSDRNSHLLFLLHSVIRQSTQLLVSDIARLDALEPDAELDQLSRRLAHLSNIVLAHCLIEDQTVLPILTAAMSKNRPTKRPRTASPVSIDLPTFQDEHVALHKSFALLRTALKDMRASPLLPVPSSPLSHHHQSAGQLTTPVPLVHTLTKTECVSRAKDAAAKLQNIVYTHLHHEEEQILPPFLRYLSSNQQTALLVRVTLASVSVPHLPDAYRHLSLRDLIDLFELLTDHCDETTLNQISFALAQVLSVEQWRLLCNNIPSLRQMVLPSHDSLIEIFHMHKAIKKELYDIVAYCESIDMSHQKHLQLLSSRFNFLRKVHSYHSDGEESVLLKELLTKFPASPDSPESTTSAFQEDHQDETLLFEQFSSKIEHLQERSRQQAVDKRVRQALKHELITSARSITHHLTNHMEQEERKLLPLVRKYFTLEDQDKMMRRLMAAVPSDFLLEVIPWMFNSLQVDDQESMLRNLLRTAPRAEICNVLGTIAQSVQKGMTNRMEWNEICLRIPEIETDYKGMVDRNAKDEVGPVSEILRVHKVFRIEINDFLRRAKEIPADGSTPNPNTLLSLVESASFLRKMVEDHSHAEDFILLPRLEKRAPGVSAKYEDDHCDERTLFLDLIKCLGELRCASEEVKVERLVQKLHMLARTLRDETVSHLDREEKQLWPLLTELFTSEEQSEIVALIFGHLPGQRLRELLPWMIRILSVEERNTMMNHILQVTQSTMFQTWLKTWLPWDEDAGNVSNTPKSSSLPKSGQESPQLLPPTQGSADTARALLCGRENMERTIRAIARDSSLSVEQRTRMMQQVMLAPYSQRIANEKAKWNTKEGDKDNMERTYTVDKHGVKRLGCRHYIRGCKLRAACCDRLYTCRLCHDEAEETHVMDRTATTEILCMHCKTLQPVSGTCKNESCGKKFAMYFCDICVFYDDDESRSVYHCHSCNVCRAGKGLGVDYFHCMKCNQCMNMKYQKGHVCVEKAMESNCPVCHQFMFTSTTPVKYLKCGHLLHTSCFEKYREEHISCPLCSKSLEEMMPIYQRLDQQLTAGGRNAMPSQYRSVQCDIYCMDCNVKSTTAYHFLFNKCPKCCSYNTRVDRIDANANEYHLPQQ